MIYPVVDPKVRAERYKINRYDCYCAKCGRKIDINIPFAHNKFRGLISKSHEPCGEEYRQALCVSLDPEVNEAFCLL